MARSRSRTFRYPTLHGYRRAGASYASGTFRSLSGARPVPIHSARAPYQMQVHYRYQSRGR